MLSEAVDTSTADRSPGRSPGTAQGLVLVIVPLFSMLGAVLIAPLLPSIQATFHDTPYVDVLVPLLLTTPALCLALLSPVAGALSGRIGPLRMLIGSLVLYAAAGTAPMYLASLEAIFVSRLLVGVAEAAMVTAGTTLLSHYFSGDDRQKWFAYQSATLPLLGAALIWATGMLGNLSWRATFIMYASSLLTALAAAYYLFEVPRATTSSRLSRFPPLRPLLLIMGIAIPGSIAFYVAPVELAYLLQQRGFTQPSTAASITALGLILSPGGALISRKLTRLSVGVVLSIAMGAMGLGLIGMALSTHLAMMAACMALQQMGGGLMVVTGLTYTTSLAQPHERGVYSGAWWFVYMLAQFSTPLLMSALTELAGGRIAAVIAAGIVIAGTCAWLLAARALRRAVVELDPRAISH